MRTLLTTSLLALTMAVPAAVHAETLTFSGGATLTSRYVSSGLRQSDGIAFQPWLEGSYGGFYFGAWASNTSKDILGSSAEIDLYLGYRGDAGKLSYDIGYAHYFYKSEDVDCCGEVILALDYAFTDSFSMGAKAKYDPDAEVTNSSLSMGYAINDKFGIDATYGSVNKGGQEYWSIGGSYAINDAMGVSLAYHDNDADKKDTVVLSMDYAFDWK